GGVGDGQVRSRAFRGQGGRVQGGASGQQGQREKAGMGGWSEGPHGTPPLGNRTRWEGKTTRGESAGGLGRHMLRRVAAAVKKPAAGASVSQLREELFQNDLGHEEQGEREAEQHNRLQQGDSSRERILRRQARPRSSALLERGPLRSRGTVHLRHGVIYTTRGPAGGWAARATLPEAPPQSGRIVI